MTAEEVELFRVRVMRLGCASVLAGLPPISIPVGTVAVVGLSFIAWAGGDEALLDLVCDIALYCGVIA
jgi:amidase